MIQSMTAFARSQSQGMWGNLVCEIRSINHRYLELTVRLPEALHSLEIAIRDHVRQHIQRGKIECSVRYQSADIAHSDLKINTVIAENLMRASERVAQLWPHASPINPLDILRWPGVLTTEEIDQSTLEKEVASLLEKTVQDLIAARRREGAELNRLFSLRLDSIKAETEKVRLRMPAILQEQRERLMNRFHEANIKCDNDRLEQELVLYAQKIDVMEELERLDTHVTEVIRVLGEGGAVGRRLDFLMQELNREANTLGSKSVDTSTTRVSVELKVLIEQIREQVQNIE